MSCSLWKPPEIERSRRKTSLLSEGFWFGAQQRKHGVWGFRQSTTEEENWQPEMVNHEKKTIVTAELVEQLIILCASQQVKTNKACFNVPKHTEDVRGKFSL